jgi:flagellar basal-body rod protein FlgF
MPGGIYVALSGMRSRLDALDRVASDIANVNTAGYKTERSTTEQADRPSFGEALQSAIDVTDGPKRIDTRAGALASTGRDLDIAIEGNGYFVVDTANGPRYTRDGRFTRNANGELASAEGDPIRGAKGPIKVGNGPVDIDADGTVRSGGAIAGTIDVVDFPSTASLVKEGASRFSSADSPTSVARPSLKAGAIEQSNVSVVASVAELTSITRSFETLQKAISVLSNDVDGRAITELGRR